MRKLMCLVAMISGFSMGCGDGDKDDKGTDTADEDAGGGNGTGNGNGDIDIPDAGSPGGDEELPFPECPRDDIPAQFDAYTGPKIMTQEDYMACASMCMQDQACFDMCPGAKEFGDCLNNDLVACSAKEKGTCRTEYVNFTCCGAASMCAQGDMTCIETKCGTELTEIRDCIGADMICLRAAGSACFAPTTAMSAGTLPSAAISREALTIKLQQMHHSR